jgi:HSP20 family molecular chaperone IbpA
MKKTMTENEEEKDKKIKELEEKLKKLEKAVKAGKDEKTGTEEEAGVGVAEEILGGFLPGLGKMIAGLKNSEAFKERFEEVDRELEKRMKESGGWTTRGRSSIGMRPHLDINYSVRTLTGEKHVSSFSGKERAQKQKGREKEEVKEIRVDKEVVKQKEPLIDIMAEKDFIMVIAEMPGVEEEAIKTKIGNSGTKLIIFTEGKDKKGYYKEVNLPSPVKGELKTMYKHGVLEVRLEKETEKK